MKDKKLCFLLIAQTQAIIRDIHQGRTIAAQVVAEACMIPEEGLSENIEVVAGQAIDYVNYSYGEGEKPVWVDDSWTSGDW